MKGGDDMRPNNLIIGGLLFVALLFGGCASYSPSLVRMDTFGPHTVKHTEGDLCIHMEEYASQDKCEPEVAASTATHGEIPLYQLLL
jgi:hypothetical protein